jgi:hypothetical protein
MKQLREERIARAAGLSNTFAIVLAALQFISPAEAADHKFPLIPCQRAIGAFAIVKPPEPGARFCDPTWMKAAKIVTCPPTFTRYSASCYMPPKGKGIVVYERPPGTVSFGWCSRMRSGTLTCELSSR